MLAALPGSFHQLLLFRGKLSASLPYLIDWDASIWTLLRPKSSQILIFDILNLEREPEFSHLNSQVLPKVMSVTIYNQLPTKSRVGMPPANTMSKKTTFKQKNNKI